MQAGLGCNRGRGPPLPSDHRNDSTRLARDWPTRVCREPATGPSGGHDDPLRRGRSFWGTGNRLTLQPRLFEDECCSVVLGAYTRSGRLFDERQEGKGAGRTETGQDRCSVVCFQTTGPSTTTWQGWAELGKAARVLPMYCVGRAVSSQLRTHHISEVVPQVSPRGKGGCTARHCRSKTVHVPSSRQGNHRNQPRVVKQWPMPDTNSVCTFLGGLMSSPSLVSMTPTNPPIWSAYSPCRGGGRNVRW